VSPLGAAESSPVVHCWAASCGKHPPEGNAELLRLPNEPAGGGLLCRCGIRCRTLPPAGQAGRGAPELGTLALDPDAARKGDIIIAHGMSRGNTFWAEGCIRPAMFFGWHETMPDRRPTMCFRPEKDAARFPLGPARQHNANSGFGRRILHQPAKEGHKHQRHTLTPPGCRHLRRVFPAFSCTILHLWAVVPIVSVARAKILHLWAVVPIVSVKCPAFWRTVLAAQGVSGGVAMIYREDLYAGTIMAYKTHGEGGAAAAVCAG
jgi:hypothetical protein